MWSANRVSVLWPGDPHPDSVIVGLFPPDKAVLMKGLNALVKAGALAGADISPVPDGSAIGPKAFWDWYRAGVPAKEVA